MNSDPSSSKALVVRVIRNGNTSTKKVKLIISTLKPSNENISFDNNTFKFKIEGLCINRICFIETKFKRTYHLFEIRSVNIQCSSGYLDNRVGCFNNTSVIISR